MRAVVAPSRSQLARPSSSLPAVVLAHPLGNFTINHYAGLRIEPDRVTLDVVIDQAEIPAFQARQATRRERGRRGLRRPSSRPAGVAGLRVRSADDLHLAVGGIAVDRRR